MNLFEIMSTIVLGGAAIGVLGNVARKLHAFLTRLNQFLDDWSGEPERNGVPARPGVMERIRVLEEVGRRVSFEVRPNGGSSLIDKIDRIEQQLTEVRNDRQLPTTNEPVASSSA